MKQYLLSLLLVLGVFTCSFAQNAVVTGYVIDAKTGDSLQAATVILNENRSALTNEKGRFRIKTPPGTYKLTVRMIGYGSKTQKVTVAKDETVSVDMKINPEDLQLDLVVITSSQYEKNIAEETVSMDVIGKELIKNTNATELGEAIDKTPGVQIQDGQVSLRGGSSYSYGVGSRTAVLVDGVNFMSADLGDAQLKFAPLENTQQVEVIKGASSVVYGSSALNGVVNVRTAWPVSKKPKTTITTFAGVFDDPKREELIWWDAYQPSLAGTFINHQRKIGNWQIVGGGNVNIVNSYLQDANEFRGRINFKTRYVHPKVSGLTYGLDANYMREVSERFFLSADLDSGAYRYEEGSSDRYNRYAIDPHLTYHSQKGDRFTFKGRYLNIWRRGNGSDRDASSNFITIDPQYQKNFSDRVILTFGTPFNIGFSKSNLYDGTRTNYSGAGYAQAEYKTDRLSVVGGVRYEISSVDTVFETGIPVFRSGLNYRFGKASFLRASFGQGYRIPSLGERFVAGELFGDFVFIVPNPDLVAEKSWSAEVGFKQGFKIGNFKGFFDFSTFLQDYEEFVEYRFGLHEVPPGISFFDTIGTSAIGLKPFNVENARIFGYEASVLGQGSIGPIGIRTLFGYTYTYPGNLEEDTTQKKIGVFLGNAFRDMFNRLDSSEVYFAEDSSRILQLRSRHLVRGDIEFQYKKLSLGFSFFYTSFPERIPSTFAGIFAFIDGTAGTDQQSTLEKYIDNHEMGDARVDARIAYQFSDNLRVSFITRNLFNREYSARPGKLEPPRTFLVQLNMNF